MAALMPLSADASEHGPLYAVLALKVVKRQVAVALRIVNLLHAVAVNAPDFVLPLFSSVKCDIVCRLQMISPPV